MFSKFVDQFGENLSRITKRLFYWRDGRVVECGGLENHFARKGDGGSNPPLSVYSLGLMVFW